MTNKDMPPVIQYLLGIGALDGCRFPDFPDNGERYKKRYWWRTALREHHDRVKVLLDALEAIREQRKTLGKNPHFDLICIYVEQALKEYGDTR